MIENVTIKNRSTSRVIYKIPEMGVRRDIAPGQSITVPYTEIEKLTWQPGGRELLEGFLMTTTTGVNESLNITPEQEYYMNEQQIADLILNGSLDAFLDCLDFAPMGVIDLLKQFAVDLPMTDYTKMQALKKKTGFDVEAALKNKRADEQEAAEDAAKAAQQTAAAAITPAAPTTQVAGTGRRRTTTNYKVVDTNKK